MKKQILPACVLLVLALVAAVGSCTFLRACVHEDGSFGACHWAERALLGIGCVLALIAFLALVFRRFRPGLYLSAVLLSVLGLLIPGTLIDLCRMSSMHCRAVMQPAMIILFAAAALVSLAGVFLSASGSPKGSRS